MVMPAALFQIESNASSTCFVIAEAGVNHNGSLDLAFRLVDAAAEAGADAVKFQTFQADKLVTASARKAVYQAQTTGADQSQYEMLRQLELGFDDFRKIKDYCRQQGILFLSTPFDEASADFLDSLDVAAIKIGSGEITNLPFLGYIARKGRPVILSTGMSTLGEVEAAVGGIRGAGDPPLALLHCTSNYPALPETVNLRAMMTLKAAFGLPVGYSDHTQGIEISLAAAALGARILEKHFTLDRHLPGPDHPASLEPAELAALVRGVRKVTTALGDGRKLPTQSELDVAAVARKSLVAARAISAGAVLAEADIAIKRPGTGLPPGMLSLLLGRRLRLDVAAGEVFTLEMLA